MGRKMKTHRIPKRKPRDDTNHLIFKNHKQDRTWSMNCQLNILLLVMILYLFKKNTLYSKYIAILMCCVKGSLTSPATHTSVPVTYPSAAGGVSEAADLLFVKKFSLVTSRTLPPSCWALLREAWATSSLLRYLWKWDKMGLWRNGRYVDVI